MSKIPIEVHRSIFGIRRCPACGREVLITEVVTNTDLLGNVSYLHVCKHRVTGDRHYQLPEGFFKVVIKPGISSVTVCMVGGCDSVKLPNEKWLRYGKSPLIKKNRQGLIPLRIKSAICPRHGGKDNG